MDGPMSASDPREGLRAALHRLIDEALDHRLDRPWRPLERRQREAFEQPLPRDPTSAEALVEQLAAHGALAPAPSSHPRFFGWVLGSGRPEGTIGAAAAALTNVNAFGGAQVATAVERQVLAWTRAALGLEELEEGVLLSGSSEANLLALAAARHAVLGPCEEGLGSRPRVVTAGGAHHSILRATRLLGLGNPVLVGGPDGERLDAGALERTLGQLAREGSPIAAVVATSGTPRTGDFDDLGAVAEVTAAHGVWLHVDGAYGAWARLLDTPLGRGMHRAHSVALDFHKALHAPYAAGALLVRGTGTLKNALAVPSDYLAHFPGGFGGWKDWPGERSLATSRGFGALGVWSTFAGSGLDQIRADVERSYVLARVLAERLAAEGWGVREPRGPVVVFGPPSEVGPGWDRPRPAQRVVTELQQRGDAVITPVRVDGQWALRASTLGLRTRETDLEALVQALARFR